MNSTKKNKPASDDAVNTKIQRQFNLVFDKEKSKSSNENKKDKTDGTINLSEDYDLSPIKESGTKTSMNKTESATISLDLKTDPSIKHNPLPSSDEQGTMIASNAFDATKSEGLDFNLDFNLDGGESTVIAPASSLPGAAKNEQTVATSSIDVPEKEPSLGGFVLDELDLALNLSESTQKTVVANLDLLKGALAEEETPSNGGTLSVPESEFQDFNLMDNSMEAESKATIESTIKDIVRPKFENTQEMDLEALTGGMGLSDISEVPLQEFRVDNNKPTEEASNVLDFGGNNPDEGFSLDALKEEASAVDLGSPTFDHSSTELFSNGTLTPKSEEKPGSDEFSLLSGDDDIFSENSYDSADSIDDAFEKTLSRSLSASMKSALESSAKKSSALVEKAVIKEDETSIMDDTLDSLFSTKSEESYTAEVKESYAPKAAASTKREDLSTDMPTGTLNTEDSMRFQATIRALREEREELLSKIKTLKSESKELEQDNLTLKANLDEAKIEITILRKRHMVELEDIKYRLSMSEEKKSLAEEKARQAELRKEKLEQKVRIDFNQVKQREKELESKLELLSMDVDSQVQSRDQKILELRRKIDALEFNMENASIKEQKSLDDKRKLEDRLNKIMKTLRHSIKNLEDDIDHTSEDSDQQKDKN